MMAHQTHPYTHKHKRLLHPDVPYAFIFSNDDLLGGDNSGGTGGSSGSVTVATARLFGPPKLAVLSAAALQRKLISDLDAAAAAAEAALAGQRGGGKGGGCSKEGSAARSNGGGAVLATANVAAAAEGASRAPQAPAPALAPAAGAVLRQAPSLRRHARPPRREHSAAEVLGRRASGRAGSLLLVGGRRSSAIGTTDLSARSGARLSRSRNPSLTGAGGGGGGPSEAADAAAGAQAGAAQAPPAALDEGALELVLRGRAPGGAGGAHEAFRRLALASGLSEAARAGGACPLLARRPSRRALSCLVLRACPSAPVALVRLDSAAEGGGDGDANADGGGAGDDASGAGGIKQRGSGSGNGTAAGAPTAGGGDVQAAEGHAEAPPLDLQRAGRLGLYRAGSFTAAALQQQRAATTTAAAAVAAAAAAEPPAGADSAGAAADDSGTGSEGGGSEGGGSDAGDDDSGECEICFDAAAAVAALPCGHRTCLDCARELARLHHFRPALCAFCRRVVEGFALRLEAAGG